ncbi:SAV_2336 N-terminal domain-related protein [Streptomyces sp. ISL-100]|uniref:SAV_2336 N-terminal domain-related protein n=1 Tax=Streptomyces sp. ISL-100 TaxID=2819173 RepID=UPI001BEAC352|nr:SAV_2336 N-terminal domain-related protein [Streptomyces sp. ISL-100]MBT2400248.1 tetratricopeptide repeat protein [Streptomyces sp. ISL-100]
MDLGELVGRLRSGGLDPTAEEVADAVWLAQWLPSGRTPTGASGDPRERGGATAPGQETGRDADRDADRGGRAVRPPAGDADSDAPDTDVPGPHGTAPISLYAPGGRRNRGAGGSANSAGAAFPVRAPAAAALPGLLGLQRALRPLRHYTATAVRPAADGRLDEDATAERSAMSGVITPVLRPSERPRVDIQLLMDTGPAMAVWERMVEELRQACQQSGVFRDVQVHQLYDAGDGEAPLIGTTTGPGGHTRMRPADQFHDPTGRRLTLVVSDCVGPLWQQGRAQRLIHQWPRSSPLAVVQPLPPRLWARTALPAEPGLLVRSAASGGRTAFLPDEEPWEPVEATARPVPVLPPTPEAFASWARLLSDHGGSTVRGWAAWSDNAPAHELPDHIASAPPPPLPPDRGAGELLRAFRANASPGGVRLAVHLAAAPLTLPVMQLVQRAMLPDTGPMELAEVLLGGLLRQLPGPDSRSPCYVYADGVQELLLNSLGQDAAALVLKHCSSYVERHFGRGARNFSALAAARLSERGAAAPGLQWQQGRGGEAGEAEADDGAGTGTEAGGEPELFAEIPARVLRFYQPDLITPEPLAEAERLLGQWHSQGDPSLLRRARERAEAALSGGDGPDSGGVPESETGVVRSGVVLGRVLLAEAGAPAVRGTERGRELLLRAARTLTEARDRAPEGSHGRADASLELAAAHHALWRETRDAQHLAAGLDALTGDASAWPPASRRVLHLRRGRLLLARHQAEEAVRELRTGCDLLDTEDVPDSIRCTALLDLADALRAAGAPHADTAETLARAEQSVGEEPALRLRCLTAQARLHDAADDRTAADRAYEAAAQAAPPDSAKRCELLTEWGESLLRRAAAEDGPAGEDAVGRAESVLREALAGMPARSPSRSRLHLLLGSALSLRFQRVGFLPDLYEGRHLLEEAAKRLTDGALRAEAWLTLGRVRFELVRQSAATLYSDALQAFESAQTDADSAHGDGGQRDGTQAAGPGSQAAARALYAQGCTLEFMGRTEAARRAYEHAHERWQRLVSSLVPVDWREAAAPRERIARLAEGERGTEVRADDPRLPEADRRRLAPPWRPFTGVRAG